MAYLHDDTAPEGRPANEDRLIMLCDGVFAIAITLLVLDIRIPDGSTQFSADLSALLRKIMFYFVTFLIIAGYWIMHRRVMRQIKRLDRRFIWFTFLFLSFVALFPATMNLLGAYGSHYETVIIYVATISACGFSVALLWIYASWNHRLIDADIDQEQINFRTLNILINPVYFALSLLLLFFFSDPTSLFFSWIFIGFPVTVIQRVYRYRLSKRVQQGAQGDSARLLEELNRSNLFSPFAAFIDFFLSIIPRLYSHVQAGRTSPEPAEAGVRSPESYPSEEERSAREPQTFQDPAL